MENLSKAASMLQIVDHAIVVEVHSEVEAEEEVEVVEILDAKRKVRKLKKGVIKRENMTQNLRRSHVDKEEVIIGEEAGAAAVEEDEVVVTADVQGLVAKDREMSLGLTRMITMKAIVQRVIATIRGDLHVAKVIQADDQEDSEDVQDVHHHKVQVMKVVTTAITTVAEINTVMAREEIEIEMTLVVMVIMMVIEEHEEEDTDATEKLSKEVKMEVRTVDKTKESATSPTRCRTSRSKVN